MLMEWNVCPGCRLIVGQTPHKSRQSAVRRPNWSIQCQKFRIQEPSKPDAFVDGKMAQQNIVVQTLKYKKSKGSKVPGILSMHTKSAKKELQSNDEKFRPKSNRVGSKRAESYDDQCLMRINIFLAPDDFYYLSTSSVLQHIRHSCLPPDAIIRSGRDLDEDEHAFIGSLCEHRVRNSTITKILQTMKGKDGGHLFPCQSTVCTKNEKMINIAKGITANMSDAQKTLKQLEW